MRPSAAYAGLRTGEEHAEDHTRSHGVGATGWSALCRDAVSFSGLPLHGGAPLPVPRPAIYSWEPPAGGHKGQGEGLSSGNRLPGQVSLKLARHTRTGAPALIARTAGHRAPTAHPPRPVHGRRQRGGRPEGASALTPAATARAAARETPKPFPPEPFSPKGRPAPPGNPARKKQQARCAHPPQKTRQPSPRPVAHRRADARGANTGHRGRYLPPGDPARSRSG